MKRIRIFLAVLLGGFAMYELISALTTRREYYPDGALKGIHGIPVFSISESKSKGRYTDYYHSGRIQETGCVSGFGHIGALKRWAENGQLVEEKFYDEPGKLQDGKYFTYHPDGSKKTEENYFKRMKNGLFGTYGLDGSILDEWIFTNDIPADGHRVIYNSEKKILEEHTYKNGEDVAPTMIFDANGIPQKQIFVVPGGTRVMYRQFDPIGKVEREEERISSTKIVVREYFPNGKLRSEKTLDPDLADGTSHAWFSNGNLKWEIKWNHGLPNGKATLHYPSGALRASLLFSNGRLQPSAKCWDENARKTDCPKGNPFDWKMSE
jgi:antitoxin component YwqK of YwqJK toxin-antitoxin module